MSAIENKRSVVVGIFVLLAIIIFLGGIFILAGQQKRFISTVTVRAIFDDVAGLRQGNNVWFSGVKIGTIRGINLYGDSQVEITMNIEERHHEFVRKNAKARISSESFIGNKNIVIEGGTPEAPPVEDGDVLAAVNPLNTDDLMETLQENNQNLVAITGDFKELSSRIVRGEGTVGALLTDTAIAQNFKAMVASLQQTSDNTVRASQSLSRFTAKLNSQGGLVDELLTDTTVYSQLRASIAQLQEASTSASQMTASLQRASENLTTNDNALGMLLNDVNFAATIRKTMYNLESSSHKLDENMKALQSNFLFRGYFRRQQQDIQKADQEKAPEPPAPVPDQE
ncbi:MlaD family protein [Pontibacter sp. SGAir0037]|uniref:MlaD family protein n=1 Tax=Pontibacter sp. SGAir0037 TaxID=2571030 RepID=UPI0010CD0C34|nr:MlaD family protein [Pontibacter sp. SGAir0037]QCR22630.1 MCE family protein [Pontibacter sp. SGAir0037]